MFAVAVTFKIDPTQMRQFKEAMLQNAKNSLANESGCRQFDVCLNSERPSEIFLYEVYDDEAAFNVHLESAHFASFKSIVDGMILGKSLQVFQEVHQ